MSNVKQSKPKRSVFMIPGSTYNVLQESDLSYLIVDVNNSMEEGWEPLGAPFFARSIRNEDEPFWCQAMVKNTNRGVME